MQALIAFQLFDLEKKECKSRDESKRGQRRESRERESKKKRKRERGGQRQQQMGTTTSLGARQQTSGGCMHAWKERKTRENSIFRRERQEAIAVTAAATTMASADGVVARD